MTITEIGIENFGKLSEYRIKLSDGLNSFLCENGYGKTTLTYFIKAMLYGLEQTTKQSLFENERRRFSPWGGGRFGGFMCFRAKGREYRVERSFGSKLSEDTFALFDLKTSLPSSDYTERLGEELFGIDADGFERTVFISEKLIDGENKNPTVAAKLSDLSGVDGDLSSFDIAVNAIDKQIKIYKKKGGGGILRDAEHLISDAEKELEKIAKTEREAIAAEADIAVLERRQGELLSNKAELEKLRESALIAKTAEIHRQRHSQMLSDIEARRAELGELSHFFEKKLPSDEETYFAADNMAKYERAMSILSADSSDSTLSDVVKFIGGDEGYMKARELSRKRAEMNDAERALTEFNEASFDVGRTHKPSAYIAIAAAVLLLISVPLIFLLPVATAFTLSAAAVLFVFALLAKRAEVKERISIFGERERKLSALRDEYGKKKLECEELLSYFRFPDFIEGEDRFGYVEKNLASYKIAKESLDAAAARHEGLLRDAEEAKERATRFLSLFPTESERPFDEIREKRARYDALTSAIERGTREADEYARRNDLGKSYSSSVSDMNTISEAAAGLDGEILENERELISKRSLVSAFRRETERADEICDRKNELSEKLDAMRQKYDALLKTKELLGKAKSRMSEKYIGKTGENFRKYMALMGGENEDVSIDTNFTVTKTDKGATRPYESYSKGTRDMMTLAVRMALCDSLYDGEKPPLILDDPYCALDDGRVLAAKNVLGKLACERQILYFTCSASRAVK